METSEIVSIVLPQLAAIIAAAWNQSIRLAKLETTVRHLEKQLSQKP